MTEPEGKADVEDEESKILVATKFVGTGRAALNDGLRPLINQNIEIMAYSLFEKHEL